MKRKKRTKILATIGPATGNAMTLERMVAAGVNAFRVNFSHGSVEERQNYLQELDKVRSRTGKPVATCADLCGPKIRVGKVENNSIELTTGDEVIIQRQPVLGTPQRISTTLRELADLVKPGEQILLADGRLKLEVIEVRPPEEFRCRILVGGELKSGKGVNLPQTELPLSALTEKDRADLNWIAQRDFDYIALSFVRAASDVRELRELLTNLNSTAQIIAKIEKPQALEAIDEIIAEADAVMVARGDLGVEMDYPEVPIAQKRIASKARQAGKPCIIATEMLESMISAPRPTRAEVSDVANAVHDLADAVMLSAESAIGEYPVETAWAMNRTLVATEKYVESYSRPPYVELEPARIAALASAIDAIMEREDIAAVAIFTDGGFTTRIIAKLRLRCPVLAVSPSRHIARRSCLYYSIIGREVCLLDELRSTGGLLKYSSVLAQQAGLAIRGDKMIVIGSFPLDQQGATNGLTIIDVE